MAQIQGGHCPCYNIQGGQPTTLPPPCRAPATALRACRRRQLPPSLSRADQTKKNERSSVVADLCQRMS